jgi:integrase
MTLAGLIDKFVYQYNKKDTNILNRLKWWTDHYGHLRVNEMTEEYVRHGINALLSVGSTGSAPIAPQTTNRFKANLSSVFEFAKEKYNIKHNPCKTIRSRPEGDGRKRYLSEEDQLRFLQAAKKSRWDKFYLLILMAITSGARKGELEKLRFCDLDYQNSTALCTNTKNGSDKVIPLTDVVLNELKKFRSIGNGLIFCHPKRPTSVYDWREEWKVALEQAGLDGVDNKGERLVFHSMRHTFCSTLANRGTELHSIATLAGHRSIQTTMRYIHSDKKRLASVVNETFRQLA